MSYRTPYEGGGRPGMHREYFVTDTSAITASAALMYAALAFIGVYAVIHYLDIFPTLPLSQLVWNAVVYMTPPSLVVALEGRRTGRAETTASSQTYTATRSFAAKSEAMRHILGLSGDGFLYSVRRTRRLSGFGPTFNQIHNPKLPGLGNWDNSCYQNSILQGLSSLPSLYAFLREASTSIPGIETRPTNFALQHLIEDLNNPKNLGRKLWTPAVLKSMSSWQQQDAQEYYSKVVDALEKELNKGIVGLRQSKGFQTSPKRLVSSDGFADDEETPATRNPLEGWLAQRVGCLRCGHAEGITLLPFNCLTVPLGNQTSYTIESLIDGYMGLEPISGVECPHCTLLGQREVLQRLVSLEVTAPMQPEAEHHTDSTPPGKSSAAIQMTFLDRLNAVNAAIEEGDFTDGTLSTKCLIPKNQRVLATKTRQAVIARPPKSLVIHVNRSVFDENTGMLRKNYADVRFPKFLHLSRWILGSQSTGDPTWSLNPAQSMLEAAAEEQSLASSAGTTRRPIYALRAVVTHQGRHENGHYIAFRKNLPGIGELGEDQSSWWRLSDEDVCKISEQSVFAQGGVFMLFYEEATEPERCEATEPRDAKAALATSYVIESENGTSAAKSPPSGQASSSLSPQTGAPGRDAIIPARISSLVREKTSSSEPGTPGTVTSPARNRSRSGSPATMGTSSSVRHSSSQSSSAQPAEDIIVERDSCGVSSRSPPSIPARKASRSAMQKSKASAEAAGARLPVMRTSVAGDASPLPHLDPQGRGMVPAN